MATFSATEIADRLRFENKHIVADLKPLRSNGRKPVLGVGRKKNHFFISLYVPALDVIISDLYRVGLSDADITQIAYVFKTLAGNSKMRTTSVPLL